MRESQTTAAVCFLCVCGVVVIGLVSRHRECGFLPAARTESVLAPIEPHLLIPTALQVDTTAEPQRVESLPIQAALQADTTAEPQRVESLLIPADFATAQLIWGLGTMPKLPTVVSQSRLLLTAYLAYDVLSRGVPGDFVETGVYTGGSTVVLYQALRTFSGGGRRLFACDSFDGLPPPTADDRVGAQTVGEAGWYRAGLDTFMDNMRAFDSADANVLIPVKGWFRDSLAPMVAVHNVQSISFLRLDGDLYDSTHDPLVHLYAKLSPGGIVYVDDYFAFNGCRKAIDEFRAQNGITSPLHMSPFEEAWPSDAGPRQMLGLVLLDNNGFELNDPKREAVWWRK